MNKQGWVLINKTSGEFVKSTKSGITFTDNINAAKIYNRLCDVSNSISYWNNPWRGKAFQLISQKVQLKIEFVD